MTRAHIFKQSSLICGKIHIHLELNLTTPRELNINFIRSVKTTKLRYSTSSKLTTTLNSILIEDRQNGYQKVPYKASTAAQILNGQASLATQVFKQTKYVANTHLT